MRLTRVLIAAGLSAAVACGEGAELRVDGDGLLERAKVTDEAARASALARIPGGSVVAAELEDEDGAFIYSYDIEVAGVEGIEEVHVDALTGRVVSVEHEDSEDEAEEADEPRR